MKKPLIWILVLFLVMLPRISNATELNVVLVGSAPFVIDSPGGEYTGLSVDLWKGVAEEQGLSYKLSYVGDSVDVALQKLENGEADLIVGPISITAKRNSRVTFTQPYFHAGLAILAPEETSSLTSMVKPFITKAFLSGAIILASILLVIGFLVWLAEHKKNDEHFPKDPVQGISEGLWFALVTMTTVGYGDKTPKSFVGKFISGIWMLASIVTVSSLTAFIASSMAVAQVMTTSIDGIDQLRGKRVAVIEGTTSQEFVKRNGCRLVRVDSLNEAVRLMKEKKVSAIVHDRPVLSYMLQQEKLVDVNLSKTTYEIQGYGFAISDNVDSQSISTSILRFSEARKMIDIEEKWLGSE